MEGNEDAGMQFLIAANSKRAQLIFNIFRPIDLYVEIAGLSTSFILFLIFNKFLTSLISMILVLLPGAITTFLVLPIPNYQNVMCIIHNIYVFYFVERQQYGWKGWDATDEFK